MGLWILIPMFFLLLILGVPIAYVLLTTALVGAVGMLGINAQIITQSLFNYLNSYTILAVPFFIISGGIAAKGGTASADTAVTPFIARPTRVPVIVVGATR